MIMNPFEATIFVNGRGEEFTPLKRTIAEAEWAEMHAERRRILGLLNLLGEIKNPAYPRILEAIKKGERVTAVEAALKGGK